MLCANTVCEVMKMADINSLDNEAQEYFYSMPIMVQEQIMQSNMKITCREDLERCCKNIMSSGGYDSQSTIG